MLPERPDTVSTLAPGPEDADEHQERPDPVTKAPHSAILGPARGPSRTVGIAAMRRMRTCLGRVFRCVRNRVDVKSHHPSRARCQRSPSQRHPRRCRAAVTSGAARNEARIGGPNCCFTPDAAVRAVPPRLLLLCLLLRSSLLTVGPSDRRRRSAASPGRTGSRSRVGWRGCWRSIAELASPRSHHLGAAPPGREQRRGVGSTDCCSAEPGREGAAMAAC